LVNQQSFQDIKPMRDQIIRVKRWAERGTRGSVAAAIPVLGLPGLHHLLQGLRFVGFVSQVKLGILLTLSPALCL
jgi:hypothetical protein